MLESEGNVMSKDLPNIVLAVLDTSRRDRYGCYGYRGNATPTTDALAVDGLQFDAMVSNAPWTVPAHGSLFTGLYPTQHGAQWRSGMRLRPSVEVTLAGGCAASVTKSSAARTTASFPQPLDWRVVLTTMRFVSTSSEASLVPEGESQRH